MGLTTDGSDPELHESNDSEQNKKYLVLSDEERSKGFIEVKKDPKIELTRKFTKERSDYSIEIRSGVELLYSIKNLKEIQVKFLSLRQRLLEDNHKLLEYLRSANKKLKDAKSREWERISKGLAERYQAQEKKILVDGKTSEIQDTVDMIQDQISFYAESIKTVDSVLYGLKTRLDVEKLLG